MSRCLFYYVMKTLLLFFYLTSVRCFNSKRAVDFENWVDSEVKKQLNVKCCLCVCMHEN